MAVSRIDDAGLNVTQYGNKNVIINGAMMISQRQTSSSNVGNQYVLDRFEVYKQNTASTYTCSQNSVTDLAGFNNSLKMLCSTADTSIASNEEVKIIHKIEGQDLQRFQKGYSTAQGFTLSFYVKTNKTGTYIVELYDRDNGRDVSGSYTVSDTGWNRYTINFPADTTGKFDDDNASSLEIQFWLVAGSAVQGGTLNTSWRSATDPSSATGQINFADTLNNSWEITGVQLEVGDTATGFEHRSYGDELARCQRYYYKWYNDSVGNVRIAYYGAYNATRLFGPFTVPVPMRISGPTVTHGTGTYLQLETIDFATQLALTNMTIYQATNNPNNLFGMELNVASGATAGEIYHLTSFNGGDSTNNFIAFDAEL